MGWWLHWLHQHITHTNGQYKFLKPMIQSDVTRIHAYHEKIIPYVPLVVCVDGTEQENQKEKKGSYFDQMP